MYRLITTDEKFERPCNPVKNANIFEILTFSWLLNLFKTGQKKEIDENDLYETLNEHASSSLGNELEKRWRVELANKANRKPSLLRVLIQMFGAKYMIYGFFLLLDAMILRVSEPLLISGLLSYFKPEGSDKSDLRYAYICATGLMLSKLISVVLLHTTKIEISLCTMKMRIACCSMIYRKSLRLNQEALGKTTVGQMINLVSNDLKRFDLTSIFLHFLWIGPLQTIEITYFLWQEIGLSSLFGIGMLLFFIPLQGWFGKRLSVLRSKTAKKTDERLRLMNEIISGIQVIKMYTWEKPFANFIAYARKKEVRQIRRSTYINAILLSLKSIQTRIQLSISILTYVLLGNEITIQKVFVVTAFYNSLMVTMSVFFAGGLGIITEFIVSIKRVQNFLMLEEKKSQQPIFSKRVKEEINAFRETTINNENLTKTNIIVQKNTNQLGSFGIVVSHATATWTNDQAVNCFENINLTVRPDRLVAIVGQIGAGKSSLLQAILGELPLSKGTISVGGKISYASQEPWLFSGSIQQNILFDSPMDKDRYKHVLQVCALKTDLKQFPHGDRTMVGERGVTLSGGQRARINLARAIYRQADIYLLDDPLSAVDARVGAHLFEKCIKEFLKAKTCILVTHQIQYLTNVDHIVLMENACILSEGSFQELQSSVLDIQKLLEPSNEKSVMPEIETEHLNNRFFKTDSLLTSIGSNDSILSSIDECESIKNLEVPQEAVESRTSGQISKNIYLSYILSGGSTFKIVLYLLMHILTQVLITGGDYWITYWVNREDYDFRYSSITPTNKTSSSHDLSDPMSISNIRQTFTIVYIVLIISMIVSILIQLTVFVSFCMTTSINLHDKMLNAIIRATMLFFNMNSSGRIFNRFSKDIGAIDEILPIVMEDCVQRAFLFLGIAIVFGTVNIYLLIPTCIIGVIFYYIRHLYFKTAQSINRLECVTRSPIFAHLNESVQGLTIIRVHGAENLLSKEFDKYQDAHTSAWYLYNCSSQVFGYWLDAVCVMYITIIMFSFLVLDNRNIYGGNVGLAITQASFLGGVVQWVMRQTTVLETEMTSVERVLEYSNSPQETSFQKPCDKTLPKEWPDKGKIDFKDFHLRYSPNAPHVLKNINIQIQPMEKIGIVGRTGAGKSSIIEALFRFALNEGNILIDDIEIHEIGLQILRSKLSIIPQQPILFSGTLRTNLDPFDEYPDHILWRALDEVELKVVVENLPGGLNSEMSERGSNYSYGQRQLVCLARALLRNNKIIVLDEATANVDQQTDALIQNTIRNKFQSCTVLTIAHRLNTVMDSDKILVMDDGNVVEFDHPHVLLKNENGYLYKMVEQTGHDTAAFLRNIASESFQNIRKNK